MMGWCPYDLEECHHDEYCDDCQHNKKEISRVIPCNECAFSIFIPHDMFTGKPRYHCGKGNEIIDENGDIWSMSDTIGGGCEYGKRKVEQNEYYM